MGVHRAGGADSHATRGREREGFIEKFLAEVFPRPYRFGSGDITSQNNERSGQVDVVVEFPFLPSLPIVPGSSTRLYLAEGAAAVIEVKSDVANQWSEVLGTARQLAKLRRGPNSEAMTIGHPSALPPSRIPLFAVGYTGWKRHETLVERLGDGEVDGILVLENGLFASKALHGDGPLGLWALIASLHQALNSIQISLFNPVHYGLDSATSEGQETVQE